MVFVELTSTPSQDLPLAAFKEHLRLGSGFSDEGLQDDVLESYIRAAMAAIEARIGKVLFQRRVSWTVTQWTSGDRQPLPVAPATNLVSVVLTDVNGNDSSLDVSDFILERDPFRPKLIAKNGCLAAIPVNGTATMTLDAGFGPLWSDIAPDLRQAVMLLAAHYYDNRSETGSKSGMIPFGVLALLETHRELRTFLGKS